MRFSVEEKLREVEREIGQRRSVYARQILYRKLSQHEADRRIAIMAEIADMLRELLPTKVDLFNKEGAGQ